jgi:hypothetical protein
MKTSTTIITCLVISLACICLSGAALAAVLLFRISGADSSVRVETSQPTPIAEEVALPTELVDPDTLEVLANTVVPENDPADLAQRLGGVRVEIPETVSAPAAPLTAGAEQTFWAFNVDSNENLAIEATLAYVTPHVYFWHERDRSYDMQDIRTLVNEFENHIYPTVREFFGSEWTPGIDNDPHIYILYTGGIGNSIAGYFSSADEMHPLVHEYSNAHEMFFINADNVRLSEFSAYSVLAHEFQHMVHWNRDRNETTWMNEGFSELAALLSGYYDHGFDRVFTVDPDIQLNTWPDETSRLPHYGGAYLFLAYFLERYGETATQELVGHPQNGFASIDQVLVDLALTDPLPGRLPNGDNLFQDFSLALYLNDPAVGDGRYAYTILEELPQPDQTETVSACPSGEQNRDVSQYGIDYIRVTCSGSHILRFTGATQTPVVPADPYSGDYAFWSNRGDSSDMTLTRSFDFRGHQGPLTLDFWTWYDLEDDYDYAYLAASTDGDIWEILTTPGGTPDDPSGNSFGWAYNGPSVFWVQEQVDISRFAGEQVQLRFEYVTDAAVNGAGMLIDDIRIPEVGYFSDFENDDGGWEAAGFVRIKNQLPQTFLLALITRAGDEVNVEYIDPGVQNTAEIPLTIGNGVDEAVLVVSGTARYSRQRAGYLFELTAP